MRDWMFGACVAIAASWLVAAQDPSRAGGRTIQELLCHPPGARLLVLHADDLGMAHSVNRATFETLEQGLAISGRTAQPASPEKAQRYVKPKPNGKSGS